MRIIDPPAVASLPYRATPEQVQAMAMLETFASIGATHFDITHTHLSGEKRGFRANRTMAEVCQSMPYLVTMCRKRQNNVIVRPRVAGATCIQLDDLDGAKAARIAPAAFMVIETSPGNYQAWVAVSDAPTGTTARLRAGIGADKNASGATRVAGTPNFKEKYAPHFPIVTMKDEQRGHIVTVANLESLGVLAPEVAPLPTVRPGASPWTNGRTTDKWPSYQQCLDRAPNGPSGHPQRTSVDFTWCMMALSWGHSIEATAGGLMQESTKAQENGKEYALKTAQRAAWAAERRNAAKPPRMKP
jgi:hypothetical protein